MVGLGVLWSALVVCILEGHRQVGFLLVGLAYCDLRRLFCNYVVRWTEVSSKMAFRFAI